MKNFINTLINIDKPIYKIMKKGLNFSFVICVFSLLVLITYKNFYISSDLYDASLLLFKTGIFFATQFIMCAIVTNMILKAR